MANATIPLFPCKALAETLDFYQALGFEVTHRQETPYLYGAVSRDEAVIHFSGLGVYGAKNAFGSALVFVSEVADHHRAFADGLRACYGRVPTAGLPRLTRLHEPAQTRFKIFDPMGNMLIYIDRHEPEGSFDYDGLQKSALLQALENALFLRDVYANDVAAAKVLAKALAGQTDAELIERARVLAVSAELAVAMDDSERLEALKAELAALPLSEADRQLHRQELQAADELMAWIYGFEDKEEK